MNNSKIKNFNIIYGYHIIKEALFSKNINISLIIININKKYNYSNIIKLINFKNISIKYLNNKIFYNIINKYKNNKKINDQGIIAYINFIKKKTLNYYLNKKKLIILILYLITDIKNIGNIIRTSLCFNVDIIIIKKNLYIYNSEIFKISSGAIFKINIIGVNNIINTIKILIKNNIKILSISEKSNINTINFFKNKIYNSVALILGNEETGIPKNILSLSNNIIKIPINKNKISSLNVSIACSIILYEIYKNFFIS
ncbi:MAG: hypothetical protein RDO_1620 [Flavobacteriales endosymbiont of Rhyzopertha dominica]|nr:MAG: 23S rRNA (guanosine(2251)-2'-O)-methyltransferase RlmB [Candidatus Shikimatogenerans bostrichidophilus]